jgi:large subunit ribosomal protein L7e
LLKALKESRAKAKTDRAAARKTAASNAEKYY